MEKSNNKQYVGRIWKSAWKIKHITILSTNMRGGEKLTNPTARKCRIFL